MRSQKFLLINENQTTDDLKKEFNRYYPFLRLEFFQEAHVKGKGTSRNKMISGNIIVSYLQTKSNYGKIYFADTTTVAELEEEFLHEYGLNIQVFRKSGKVWLETTSTDDWALAQQNEEGKNLAIHFRTERENPDDHDIY